jgi:hypothetical protein
MAEALINREEVIRIQNLLISKTNDGIFIYSPREFFELDEMKALRSVLDECIREIQIEEVLK